MIKVFSRVFSVLGTLCITFSLLFAGYNLYSEVRGEREAEYIMNDIRGVLPEIEQEHVSIPDPDYEMPTIEIKGVRYVGTITMPSLDIEFPVASEWNYTQLKKSPCRYSGSAYSNDMVICAHNYRTHFGRITRLKEGAEIVFTDVDKNVFRYKVYSIETLRAKQTKEMKSFGDGLSLFTCTLDGRSRSTVRAVLTEAPDEVEMLVRGRNAG